VSGTDTVFLWDAGPASGTAATLGDAFEQAAPHLGGGTAGTVEEAALVMRPVGRGGKLPDHRRTGRRWQGRLEDGAPAWRQVTAGSARRDG